MGTIRHPTRLRRPSHGVGGIGAALLAALLLVTAALTAQAQRLDQVPGPNSPARPCQEPSAKAAW